MSTDIALVVLASISVVLLLVLIYLVITKKLENNLDVNSEAFTYQEKLNKNMVDTLLQSIKNYNDSVKDDLMRISALNKENIKDVVERQDKLLKDNSQKLEKASGVLKEGLIKLQEGNEKKLEEMRVTVDEKLNVSLQTRLNQSFDVISKRLQEVYEGLGEMKNLATGVGDLKKVLTNVKTRGGWGEIQLGNLLEQMLAPNQFDSQVQIKKNSAERVDYVVVIPTKDGDKTFLPIDAKFPIEDYQRLVEAVENGTKEEVEIQGKNIEKVIIEQAKSIKTKYIKTPTTTDFAIMYLPVEALFAEVLRRPGLLEKLQRTHKIVVCGPTTLTAMLSSLQIGFRTITIEKRSTEIWNLLGTFKYEFGKFVDLLAKTQKKISEASKTLESATKKSETIKKKLKNVQTETFDFEEVTQVEIPEEETE